MDGEPLLTCVFHAAFGAASWHHCLKNRCSAAAGNRLLETHIPALFHTANAYPPLRGTFLSRGRLRSSVLFFSTYPVFALTMREKPHPCIAAFSIGKGNLAAVDRVLSLIVDLRRIFPLSFIPLVPYPPLRDTFPSRGRLFISSGEAATTSLKARVRG